MSWFGNRDGKQPPDYHDSNMSDREWLGAGRSRYEQLVSRHYGSPDTIAAGGDQRLAARDPASALYFYTKAIDTLHSIYVCTLGEPGPQSWSRQPSARDVTILDRYLDCLRQVKSIRPNASPADSVQEVTHRMRTISTVLKKYGLDASPYLRRLDDLDALAPEVDVTAVFWS